MTLSADQLSTNLHSFYGSEEFHRLSMLFPNILLTDGVKYLADNAGAYWLCDIIASYQPKLSSKPDMEFQIWTLTVKDNAGVVICERDTDDVVVRQEIPYTDFPLPSIKLYAQRNGLPRNGMTILLPSEY